MPIAKERNTKPIAAPGGEALRLRLRRRVGLVAWHACRGDNPGVLIGAMFVIIAMFAFLLRDTGFVSASNLLSIVRVSATITVMATATVFVLCAGEIDLSIASITPVSALIVAVLLSWHVYFVLAALAGVAFGAAVGLVNGLATVFFRMPSFVVTLGSMGVMEGLAQLVTNTNTVSISDDRFLYWFGGGSVGPVPILAFWSLAALVVGTLVLSYSAVGRRVLATGANASAARFSGILVGRVKVGVLVVSGIAGGLAGALYDGQYAAADFTLGASNLLSVLAAAIIGGCALSGGKGSVVGAVVASLLVGTLNNALVLVGFGAPEQLIVQGIIIVAAVVVSSRGSGLPLWRWLAVLEEADQSRGEVSSAAAGTDQGVRRPNDEGPAKRRTAQ